MLVKNFQYPPKWLTFSFINLYYIWFSYSQMSRFYRSISEINMITIADSMGLPLFSGIVLLTIFAVPYYLFFNIFFHYLYKIKQKNMVFKVLNYFCLAAVLLYTYLCLSNASLCIITIDTIANLFWIYLFLSGINRWIILKAFYRCGSNLPRKFKAAKTGSCAD